MQGMTLRKYVYVLSLTKPSPYTITVITLKKHVLHLKNWIYWGWQRRAFAILSSEFVLETEKSVIHEVCIAYLKMSYILHKRRR